MSEKYEDRYMKRIRGARGAAVGEQPSSADSKLCKQHCGAVAGKGS